MREILTLQLGNISNYTATHFWNAQESYFTYENHEESLVDHDVHWRPGIGADGSETFLPRTVIYDLKGGFGALRKINSLYGSSSSSSAAAASSSLWSREPAIHKQQLIEPSAYQKSLDAGTEPAPLTTSNVRYWSDYSRTYFHPKSAVQLYDFELHSSIRPFESFSMGAELFSSLDKEHDIVDRDWRPFVEECDLMQGIQVFTSLDDAWGGFGCSYLEQLRDEYPKSCIWVWGVQNPMTDVPREKRQLRTANVAQSLHEGYSQASILVPLALPESTSAPLMRLDRSSPWHVSAPFAALAESALITSRLKGSSDRGSMSGMAESLNTTGNRTLVSAGMSPFPESSGTNMAKETVSLFHVGSADTKKKKARQNHIFSQVTGCRGPEQNDSDAETTCENSQRIPSGIPVIRKYITPLEFPLLDSYPRIYTSAASEISMPVQSFLKTDASMCEDLKSLRAQTIRRLISLDEREGLSNGLAEIADAYREDWSSGSDDDDDDM